MSSCSSIASSTASRSESRFQVRIWRIARAIHATDAQAMLSGDGAAREGGRWNPTGMPAVYCSETSSLAMLEVLARSKGLPASPLYAILDLLIPDEHVVEPLGPADGGPAGMAESQRSGAATLAENLAFAVPSVINPRERNIVINPRHPYMREVRPGRISTFRFDSRLH